MLTIFNDQKQKKTKNHCGLITFLIASFVVFATPQYSYAEKEKVDWNFNDYKKELGHIDRSPELVMAIEDAINNMPSGSKKKAEIELHLWKLVVLAKLQKSEEAAKFAVEMYNKYGRESFSSDAHFARVRIQMVEYLVKIDDLDFAYKIIQDMRRMVYANPSPILSYTIDKSLIEVYIETYDYQRALDVALSVLNNPDYHSLESAQNARPSLLNEVAFLYNRLGDGENALVYLDYASASFEVSDLTEKELLKAYSRSSGNRARAMLLLERYEEAAELGHISLEGGKKLNETYMIASGYHLTGSAAYYLGENDKALKSLKSGIDLAIEKNLIVMKRPLFMNYSLALEKEGQFKEALHWKKRLYDLQQDVNEARTNTQKRLSDVEFKALKSHQEIVELRKANETQRAISERDSNVKKLLIVTIISLLAVGLGLISLIVYNRKTRAKLEKSEQKAQSANEAKSDFLATMSHEIRTPMNGVLGMAQVLENTDLSEDQRSYLDIMSRSGENLLAIINDILDFSKLEADKMTIHKEPNNLDQTLHDIVTLLTPRATKKSIALNYHYESSLPRSLIYDDHRIRQIVTNLIGNAIKFTPNGQVDVNVVGSVNREENIGQYQIRVADSGIGIPKEKLSLIFEKFTQAETSTTRNYGGTGLGLAISHKLIEAMGGELTVESELGKGSTFILNIQFEIASAILPETDFKTATQITKPQATKSQSIHADDCAVKTTPQTKPVETTAHAEAKHKIQILIVEDNDINQTVMKTMLNHPQINITIASNGEEALDAYDKQTFNLILMDVSMPVMDGKTATKFIRAKEAAEGRSRTPIICLTAHAMQKHKQEFLEAGMDDYLSKPVKKAQLLKLMRIWLQPQTKKAA